MDPREYRDARWYSLLREAEDLGLPAEDAAAVVARVLARQERRIRRAEDPDPIVREALADAVLGPPLREGRRRWPVAAAFAASLVALGLVVALTRPEPPPPDHLEDDQVPSLFGFDGPAARSLLEQRGLDVRLEPFRGCEVMGRVVGSDPQPGTTYDAGDSITVYTSLPASVECLQNYTDRVLAWALLDFANGRGPAPAFAARVWVYPGDGRRLVLDGDAAADPASWAESGVLAAVRAASDDVSLVSERPLVYAVPAIRVVRATEGLGSCGVPTPSVAGTADAMAVLVRPADRRGCALRVEVYRDDAGRVDAVALYRSSS
jgi:hypothetical protein